MRVADRLRRDVPTCALGTRIADALDQARRSGWTECAVVNDAGVLLGILWSRVLDGDPNALVDDVMDPGPATERLDSSAEKIARELAEHELTRRIVTTSDGELVGMFFASDASGMQAHEPEAERFVES